MARRAGSGSSAEGGGLNSSTYALQNRHKNPPVSGCELACADELAGDGVVCSATPSCNETATTAIKMPTATSKRRITPPWVERDGSGGEISAAVEGQVQSQHIDSRLAEDAEPPTFGIRLDQLSH